jgi:hypothetical protein
MPLKKEQFTIVQDDLQKVIDVDDSRGRSCPINMNLIEEGFITKDTGCALFGTATTSLFHSLFNYKLKNGTNYIIGATGDRLKKYNTTSLDWEDITSGTVTMTIATPCVVSQTAHGLKAGSKIVFSTTGALPTGLTAGTTYYVIAAGLTADAFEVSTSLAGPAVNTSGTQSGTHTITRLYTVDAEFGFQVYDNVLYGCNAVENYFKWTGTVFTEYDTAPKGNVLEIFEDRMFVTGVTAEPLSVYYSKVATPTDFTVSSTAGGVLKPIGTDTVSALENYYGQLLIFKKDTIWKMTFVYDSTVTLYVPKIELQSGTYGACGRKAVCWVENDIWFFTGREVRSLGYKDQQVGVLGVNTSVISEPIKETLYTIDKSNLPNVVAFYNDRRFYLAVTLSAGTNNTIFVCHTLYKNTWTKYSDRIKANVNCFMVIDNIVYSAKSSASYGVLKWTPTLLNDNGTAISSSVYFRKIEDKDFNRFTMYRYLDLMFKNLQGKITVAVKQDANDIRYSKTKLFYIGTSLENEEGTLGETPFGQVLIADSYGETIESAPFLKNRISFLIKAQTLTIGLSNSSLEETFTVSQYALSGFKEPRKLFRPKSIISM